MEYDDSEWIPISPGITGNESFNEDKPWSFYKDLLRPASAYKAKPAAYTIPDPFTRSRNVMGLSGSTFQEFLSQKDVALVLFYNSSTFVKKDLQHKIQQDVITASNMAKRQNHAVAAIDCFKNKRFCKEEGVTYFPTIRLYGKGECLGMVKDASNMAKRQNHAVAAIDCFKNKRFCKEEGVTYFPTIRLYGKGECLGMVKDIHVCSHVLLVNMIEKTKLPN